MALPRKVKRAIKNVNWDYEGRCLYYSHSPEAGSRMTSIHEFFLAGLSPRQLIA